MLKRILPIMLIAVLIIGVLPAANAQDEGTTFTFRVTNLTAPLPVTDAGVFANPDMGEEAGPALPGSSYSFEVHAVPGDVLSFATMLVQSNDLFFAPNPEGIALFDDMGTPITGDVTDQVVLWDAGTEVNEEPGVGENQAPRQAGPNTGDDEMGVVANIADVDDGFSYPAVAEYITVTIALADDMMMDDTSDDMSGDDMSEDDMMMEDATRFVVTIANISGDSSVPGPLAPGAYAAHTTDISLFTVGEPASRGIEALAEDGNAGILGNTLSATRFASPISPIVYVVHPADVVLFEEGDEASIGIEAVAEDGDFSFLVAEIDALGLPGGAQAIPFDATEGGPAGPGSGYEFTVTANPGDVITFVSMYVQTNDWFFGVNSLALFDEDGNPISGDFSNELMLWDAGTEVDEPIGEGPNQAPRQAEANTGPDQNGTISILAPMGDMMDDDMSMDDMDDMDDMMGMEIIPSIHYVFQLTVTAE